MSTEASDFLLFISKYYKHGHYNNGCPTIVPLDLDSSAPANIIQKINCSSELPYLHAPSLTRIPYFPLECLLAKCLEFFRNQFKITLFKKLGGNAENNSVSDGDFFNLLRTIDSSQRCEEILHHYLIARSKSWWKVLEFEKLPIFNYVSTILYERQFTNSSLTFSLLWILGIHFQAIETMSLPEAILCATDPPERLDYILCHFQLFCKTKFPDFFRLFKIRNEIFCCLNKGRPDLMKILLKYGNWKSHSIEHAGSDNIMNFNIKTPHQHLIFQRRRVQPYDGHRRKLAIQIFNAFIVNEELRTRYLETVLLWWKSMPYPYITVEELHEVVVTEYMPPLRIYYVLKAIDLYRGSVWCPDKIVPRSLKHYARYSIRSILDQKSLLPSGIDSLNIPESIRSYLKLKS